MEVEAAAVERREGARAYVTGARGTSQGVPVLPRFPLAYADEVGREGSGGARVRRSAPAPSRRSAPSRCEGEVA